ncbi:hypothetical protein G7Z17_g3757 [Cylindrodendrum hubeiense]|uniref:NAD-dependent epimerase/dehydratase domain-containing protein n=1 Tax=Cylindrodendrum hubeiense TaxID=595255 RepID=A0A9P5HG69_9HYPO|nr:hypothetical protein G7Z17_g3757 [Cylindrodendrum hubeiense]
MGLRTGIIGPAGFGGSHLCVELINRGHSIRGISRRPEKLGTHNAYTPYPIDIENCSLEQLIEAFKDLDVLVNEYGPHTGGENALQYQSKVAYFVMVGGCGSLNMPGNPLQTCSESPDWWLAYRRGIADSHAHVSYMEERLGSMGSSLRLYRDARAKLREGKADDNALKIIGDYEQAVLKNDKALTFVTACRTSFMFFNGNTSFPWTFISPPALYRSGKRTGKYETIFDELPLKPPSGSNDPGNLDGRLHGITAADLAIAIADEVETRAKVGRHWSAYSDMSDDTPMTSLQVPTSQ